PHLVYFNAPSADGAGNCTPTAVEVRDVDHSYSITAGDQTKEFHMDGACDKVKPFDPTTAAPSGSESAVAAIPMPREDLAAKASDAAEVGAVAVRAATTVVASTADTVGSVASTVSTIVGGPASSSGDGSGGSGSDDSGPGRSGPG